jgi:hypothetical protein
MRFENAAAMALHDVPYTLGITVLKEWASPKTLT